MRVKKKVKGHARQKDVIQPVAPVQEKAPVDDVYQHAPVSEDEIVQFIKNHSGCLLIDGQFHEAFIEDEATGTFKFGDYTLVGFEVENGWPQDEELETAFSEGFANLIKFFDVGRRLETAFMVLYNLNMPIAVVYAIDKFMYNITGALKDGVSPSDVREIVFVETIQYMSMLGVLANMHKTDNLFVFMDTPYTAALKDPDGFMDFMDVIAYTNNIDYRMIQRIFADGLDWKIPSKIFDILLGTRNVITPRQVVVMNNMLIALDRFISAQNIKEEDLEKLNSDIQSMLGVIVAGVNASLSVGDNKMLLSYSDSPVLIKFQSMSPGMFATLFNALIVHNDTTDLMDLFGHRYNQIKFADYLDWISSVVTSVSKQVDEANLIRDNFGIDLVSFFTQIDLVTKFAVDCKDIVSPDIRDVIFSIPLRWTLMMFDKLKYSEIPSVARNITTLALSGLRLVDIDTDFNGKVTRDGETIYTVKITNDASCCKMARDEQMLAQSERFYGQLVF